MTSNSSTIVGVFSDYGKAAQAARELVNEGIPQDAVHVQTTSRTTTAGSPEYGVHEHEGGIAGFFHNLFGNNDESKRYSTAVESGRTVVTVDATGSQADRAVDLLNQSGAVDVDTDAEKYPANDAGRTGTGAGTARASGTGSSVPVVDEELRVGKRVIQRGGVRVYSRMTERPVEEEVTLRDEHVKVERRPVDRPISEQELSGLRDQSFEVMETAEEPVIQKRARVTEEVVVGKETTERTQKVNDTVRHTDVKVERIGNAAGMENYAEDFRNDWQKNYAGSGGDYSLYEPAYQYGFRAANDERYRDRAWDEAEPELRRDYEREYPGGAWDRMKNAVRYGWEKVARQR